MESQQQLEVIPPRQASPPPESAPLFSLEIDEIREVEGRNGRWSAVSLKRAHPNAYAAIAEFVGRGWGYLELARIFGVHHLTVAAVADAEPELVKAAAKHQLGRIKLAGHLLVEQIVSNPGLVPWNMKALAAKQLLEFYEVLNGRPGQRVEHINRMDIHSDWSEVAEKILREGEDVREIEAPSETGFGEGNNAALRTVALPGEVVGEVPGGDRESEGSRHSSEGRPTTDTDSATESQSGSGDPAAGRGGDQPAPEVAETSTRSNTQKF
jgi:hypothetical protein